MKRVLLRSALFVVGAMQTAGCAVDGDATGAGEGDITNVEPTTAKRQSISNCWLYATATWAEALHKQAAHEELDLSEAYWSYWYWFDQLTDGELTNSGCAVYRPKIVETGTWEVAAELIARYGWMKESDFLPEEAGAIRSQRQVDAVAAMNAQLSSGGRLSTRQARQDRTLVIEELNRAWRLDSSVTAKMAAIFGADGRRTFHDPNATADGAIHRAEELSFGRTSLRDAVGDSPAGPPCSVIWGVPRIGAHAWSQQTYRAEADTDSGRKNRELILRVQRALNDRKPVWFSWQMDEDHIDESGAFRRETIPGRPPRDVTAHASVFVDYEIDDVPGFGLLKAGVDEVRPEALRAALDDRAKLQFFRIVNPWWGAFTAEGGKIPFSPAGPGYHDVYFDYLDAFASPGSRHLSSVVLPNE